MGGGRHYAGRGLKSPRYRKHGVLPRRPLVKALTIRIGLKCGQLTKKKHKPTPGRNLAGGPGDEVGVILLPNLGPPPKIANRGDI